MSNIPPPVRAKIVDDNGYPSWEWMKWFRKIGASRDQFSINPDVVYPSNATLTTADFGKVIIFNNGASEATCMLMNVSTKNLYDFVRIVRLGTGQLNIIPSDDMRIESGSLGGRMWCDEERRVAANVTLQVVSSTQWAIASATGRWKFR